MSAAHYETVDSLLLLLSEARERAEGAARSIADADGQAHLVEALETVDQDLLALHRRLMDSVYFASGTPASTQLALDAA